MKKQESNTSRRDFFKKSAAGVAGAALLPASLKKDTKSSAQDKKLIYRPLGKTGIKLPIVSMGATNAANMIDLIKSAFDMGMTHVDTSAGYQRGNHEKNVGQALKGRKRDSYVLATSFPMWRVRKNQTERFTPEQLEESIKGSLERLGVDFVDIYYLGGVYSKEATLHEPFIKVLKKYKNEGKIKFTGVSAHSEIPEVIQATIDSKFYDVVLASCNFRQDNPEQIKDSFAQAVKAGIGIVAMKTQAGVYWDKEKKNKINMKAALKWALQNENVTTAIPSFASVDEMKVGMSIMENLKLTPEEIKDLKPAEEGASHAGLFCAQCEKCMPQCKGDFDIPTIMRSYMYAHGYHRPAQAKEAIEHINFSQVACNDCSTCSVTCTMGFNVREKILDIMRIKDVPGEFLT